MCGIQRWNEWIIKRTSEAELGLFVVWSAKNILGTPIIQHVYIFQNMYIYCNSLSYLCKQELVLSLIICFDT